MDTNESTQQPAAADSDLFESESRPYVGRWNQLVSTTNWEKGRIISQWREALSASSAAAADYSDEAWARRVGGVTGQHVGRLRRVYDRFSASHADYSGLYWTHFHAALDWDDAEMWLEGAVQSNWSVSQMRRKRWETLGAAPELKPREEEIVVAELDEDFEPANSEQPVADEGHGRSTPAPTGPRHEGPDFGEDGATAPSQSRLPSDSASIYADNENAAIDFVRPFENLAELPDDLAESFESFKLAILRHKVEGWKQISCEEVLASLDALKEMAIAPSVEDSPF